MQQRARRSAQTLGAINAMTKCPADANNFAPMTITRFLDRFTLHDSWFKVLASDPSGQVTLTIKFDLHWNKSVPSGYDGLTTDPVILNLLEKVGAMFEDGHFDSEESQELLGLLRKICGNPSEVGELAKATSLPIDVPLPEVVFADR